MSAEPIVCVGIPTMNNEQTIEQTLDQLLEQTRPPDRIIIVDASDDSTPERIANVAENTSLRIDVFEQSNTGVGVGCARQDIYEHFDGDILVCLDTNLAVDEEWLEKRVTFHKQRPDIGILSGSADPELDEEVTSHKSPHYFRQGNCSLTRDALESVGGWDRWLARGEDWDMHIRLAEAGVPAYVRGDLNATQIEEDSRFRIVRNILNRPSSVSFLRKYGWWYVSYHPIHPLGDLLSAISLGILLGAPVLAALWNQLVLLTLIIPIGCAFLFYYMRILRNRHRFRVELDDLMWIGLFFALGYTAARQLLEQPPSRSWNYGGFSG